MKKALILSACLAVLSGPALAFGGDADARSSSRSEATAAAGASAGAVSGSHSGVYGSGNSSNRNSNSNRAYGGSAHQGQGQDQGQFQGQYQANRNAVDNSDSVVVEGDDVDQEYYNVNTPTSAGNNVWDCTKSYNGSVHVLLGGTSWGIPVTDEVCEATKLLSLAQITQDAVLIEMAKRRVQDILQDRIGYKATVGAIETKAPPQTSRVHKARPAWCGDRDDFGMTESDKKACGLI